MFLPQTASRWRASAPCGEVKAPKCRQGKAAGREIPNKTVTVRRLKQGGGGGGDGKTARKTTAPAGRLQPHEDCR